VRRFLGLLALLLATRAMAADKLLVIEDNDFLGPGGSNIQSVLPLIASPRIELLGFTVVTGDGWRDEEANYLLKFLEVAGVTSVPVLKGAVFPLVNSAARTRAWEAAYGKLAWKGAWNDDPSWGPSFHPTTPYTVAPLADGNPTLAPSAEGAVPFLLRMVHAHPHQVTILAAGPLTNLALAIREDPDFAGLAKELVFMGAIIDSNLQQVTDNADYAADFNLMFDPEAAHVVLTADWPKITAVGNVSNETRLTPEILARLTRVKTKAAAYLAAHAEAGLPLWDELAAAIVADPTLVTGTVEAAMDVNLDHGMDYGRVHVWPDAIAPHLGEREVVIVQTVDKARFVDEFIAAAGATGVR
jgi:inosine-uridine nucleoside N-ribohydrolase